MPSATDPLTVMLRDFNSKINDQPDQIVYDAIVACDQDFWQFLVPSRVALDKNSLVYAKDIRRILARLCMTQHGMNNLYGEIRLILHWRQTDSKVTPNPAHFPDFARLFYTKKCSLTTAEAIRFLLESYSWADILPELELEEQRPKWLPKRIRSIKGILPNKGVAHTVPSQPERITVSFAGSDGDSGDELAGGSALATSRPLGKRVKHVRGTRQRNKPGSNRRQAHSMPRWRQVKNSSQTHHEVCDSATTLRFVR